MPVDRGICGFETLHERWRCVSVGYSTWRFSFRRVRANIANPSYLGIRLVFQARMPPSTMCASSPFNGHPRGSDRLSRVVGGGTAGLAIAGRLAANRDISVAVIEAGSFYQLDNGNGSVIPALAPLQHVGSLPNDTQPLIDWGFVTVPQAVGQIPSVVKKSG